MIPLCKPIFTKEMENALVHAMNNERFVLGESVLKFEEEFAKYIGTDYAVSTGSGTHALQLVLEAYTQNNYHGEVITTPATFVATSSAIYHSGNAPVFADIDYMSRNISPTMMQKRITGKTIAVMPVHLYGNPADMDRINEIAKRRKLLVIEDACQAHGAFYGKKKAGNLGDAGCFSFYSTKNITVCGDGGMVTTNDEKLATAVRSLRHCGRKTAFEHEYIGHTSRLNNGNASIGRVQLKYLDGWVRKRQKIADFYSRSLRGIAGFSTPTVNQKSMSAWHLYACTTGKRDELFDHMEKNGIQCAKNYPIPVHKQPAYSMFSKQKYPNAERLSKEVICLPMFPDLEDSELKKIVEAIQEFFA